MSKEHKKQEIASKMATHPNWKSSDPGHLKKNTGPHFEKLKKSQKGRESLNKPKGEHNEGETMYLGKNENNRP